MTRVSENSNKASLNFSINKAKERLENLQLKGTTLKNVTRPSDNPIANVEALSLSAVASDNKQFLRNADYAMLQLNTTEQSLEELTELLNKAKEIAISQSSDFYDADIRKNVANEIHQLRNQSIAIANRRIGNRYIFSGFSTLTRPFETDGTYHGDTGSIKVEVAKDFFIPININGEEAFFSADNINDNNPVLLKQDLEKLPEANIGRDLASDGSENPEENSGFQKRTNIFSQFSMLISALENNDPKLIQSLLEKFDESVSRLITLRTRVGSLTSSIMSSRNQIEGDNINNEAHRSKLVDADVAELFSDITKHQQILKSTYQSGKASLNQTLLDFLR